MDPGVTAAIVAGAFATATAVVLFVLNRAKLGGLEQRIKEQDAWREYEYKARIRLYEQVKPVMFRCAESCQPAQMRLERILRQDLRVEGQHVATTAVRLFAPLVYLQEIQNRLTSVDLALDTRLRWQYVVARELHLNLTQGKAIARTDPALPSPGPSPDGERREYLTFAQLERMVESLTVESGSGIRPMRQREFEDKIQGADPDVIQTRDRLSKLFEGSSPEATPGLWRMLLAEATLMQTLTEMVAGDAGRSGADAAGSGIQDAGLLPPTFSPGDPARYAWPDGGSFSGPKSQSQAVQNYFADRFQNINDVFLKRVIPAEAESES